MPTTARMAKTRQTIKTSTDRCVSCRQLTDRDVTAGAYPKTTFEGRGSNVSLSPLAIFGPNRRVARSHQPVRQRHPTPPPATRSRLFRRRAVVGKTAAHRRPMPGDSYCRRWKSERQSVEGKIVGLQPAVAHLPLFAIVLHLEIFKNGATNFCFVDASVDSSADHEK